MRARLAGVFALGLLAGSAVGQQPADGSFAALTGRKTLFAWPGPDAPTETEEGRGRLASDRPDFTEASTTVGNGTVQIEVGHTFFRDRAGNGTRSNVHSYPEALFRVGLFADWFELRVQPNVVTETVRENGVGTTRTGFTDMYVGAKLALAEQKGLLPELAVMPQGFVPTGADAFTANEVLFGVNVLYGWDVTDRISVAGSSQVNKQIDDAGRSFALLAQSATIGYKLTDTLGAYTEYFVLMPAGGTNTGGGARHVIDGGFQFFVSDDLAFDIRAGYGLSRSAPDFFGGAGFVVRY